MTNNGVKNTVAAAATAFLITPIEVHGVNSYTIGTNHLSWDDPHSYLISDVAMTFGQLASTDDGSTAFICGQTTIPVFDFGLLFSCFRAMVAAKAEFGDSIPTEYKDSTVSHIDVSWFGNHGVLHSQNDNLIIAMTSSNVQKACMHSEVLLDNFTDTRKYKLTREKNFLALENEYGEFVCSFSVPTSIKRSYPNLFAGDGSRPLEDDITTPWDERSQLGAIIASSCARNSAEETLEKYKMRPELGSVVARYDLIHTPKSRYESKEKFIGSICYTDRDTIALAVNFRNTLFVYRNWFNGGAASKELCVDSNPDFSKFFDVTEECKVIMRFAENVMITPPTAADLNLNVFETINTAFYNLELSRIPFASSLGRVVIPESVLIGALSTSVGENLYCIVPVGAIGNNIVTRTSSGELAATANTPWGVNDYFFDVTEVLHAVL